MNRYSRCHVCRGGLSHYKAVTTYPDGGKFARPICVICLTHAILSDTFVGTVNVVTETPGGITTRYDPIKEKPHG